MRFFNAVVLWLVCITGLQAQISVVPTVKHLTSTSTPSAGAISLVVTGGTSPYSYTWTPGSIFTKDITNKVKNTYVVKVKDSAPTTVTYTYNIGYKAEWDQMYRCISRNDSLINNGVYSWCQAITKNNLAANTAGWVEYILKGTGETKVFGVLDSLSPLPGDIGDIDYGYYYDGNLYEVIYGSLTNVVWGGYPEGTALRVERSGTTIKFMVNGVATHTITDAAAAAKVWKVKALTNAYVAGSSIVNMGCSFVTKGGVTFRNYSNLVPYITHSSGSGINDGSVRISALKSGSYTYTWQPGSIASATITSKPAGQYTVSAKDAINTITPKVYNIGYKTKWDQLYGSVLKHDTLNGNGFMTTGTAITKNTLVAGTDGWFEYVLRNTDQDKLVGFTDSLSPVNTLLDDVDYGFYHSANAGANITYIVIHSALVQAIYYYPEGTVLRVERVGSTINFKVNGVTVYSEVNAIETAKSWKIKGAVLSNNGSLINVGCSFYTEGNATFKNYSRLIPYITHSSGLSSTDGSVIVRPLITGAYTYTWQPGSIASATLSSKAIGSYVVTAEDASNHKTPISYNISYKANWDHAYGCDMKHDTLQANGTTSWGTAVTKNTLAGGIDGWFEYVMRGTETDKIIGFTDSLSPLMGNLGDVDYGFYYASNSGSNFVYLIINGGYYSPVYFYPEGTIFRVERINDTINFRVNGVLVYTEINSGAAAKPWKLKGAVSSYLNASLINVGCSFYQQGNADLPNYTLLLPTIVHSSGVVPGTGLAIPNGSIKVKDMYNGVNTYTWQPGGETDSIVVSKPPGLYSVKVQDALFHGNKQHYNIGYKAVWDSLYGAQLNGDTLVVTSPSVEWGQGVTKNTLSGGTDGWFEYVLKGLDDYKFIGFLDSVSPTPENFYDLDYAFYYQENSRILYTIAEGNWVVGAYSLMEGTLLRIERVGDTINFKINGVIIRSLQNAATVQKEWKLKALVNLAGTSSIINAGCSFDAMNSIAVEATVSNYTIDHHDDRGKIELQITGGIKPYNIAWNGVKLPSSTAAYNILTSLGYPLSSDSVVVKNGIDSLKQVSGISDLGPGKHPVTVYDQLNDSVNIVGVVGSEIDTAFTMGVMVAPNPSHSRRSGNTTYFYGRSVNIEQSGTFISGRNFAVLANVIKRDENNVIEFTIPDTLKTEYVGLRDQNPVIAHGTDDVMQRICMEFSGSKYHVWVNTAKQYSGSYNPGDVFEMNMDPSTDFVYFYRNDVQAYKYKLSDVSGTENLMPKFVHGSALGEIKNISIKIDNAIKLREHAINAIIGDVTCDLPCSGSIYATGQMFRYKYSPVKYELYSGSNPDPIATVSDFSGGDHAVFTNLCAGVYIIKYCVTAFTYYHNGNPPVSLTRSLCGSQMFEIGYKPEWMNKVNVTSSLPGTLTKTSGNTLNWDAGASSANYLVNSSSGWIEWTTPSALSINDVGFSDADQNQDIANIDYGVGYIKLSAPILGSNQLHFRTNNNTMINAFLSGSPWGAYSGVRRFRLEKNGNNLIFKMNGAIINQTTISSTSDLVMDASLKTLSGTINDLRMSFGCGARDWFAELKKQYDAGCHFTQFRTLKFKYIEEYNQDDLDFKIYDFKRQLVVTNPSVVAKKEGDNRYSISFGSLVPSGIYYLEVRNGKGELSVLKFKL